MTPFHWAGKLNIDESFWLYFFCRQGLHTSSLLFAYKDKPPFIPAKNPITQGVAHRLPSGLGERSLSHATQRQQYWITADVF